MQFDGTTIVAVRRGGITALAGDGKAINVAATRTVGLVESGGGDDTNDYYNWETSNIRDWLNSDFMELAFNDEQMDSIMLTNNPIPDTGLFNDIGTEATNDYVFLLSLNELNLLEQTNTLYIDSIAGTFYYAYLPEAAAQGTPYYDSLDYDLATLSEMSIDPEAYAECIVVS